MFTKAISEGQLLSSSGVNTIMGDISGSWAEVTSDKLCCNPNLYSLLANTSTPASHYYYLNPAGDVYIQLQRIKFGYVASVLHDEEYYFVAWQPQVKGYYNVGGGEVEFFDSGTSGSGTCNVDLGAIPASTSDIATDAYIKITYRGGCMYHAVSGYIPTSAGSYSSFRLQYTVSTSI